MHGRGIHGHGWVGTCVAGVFVHGRGACVEGGHAWRGGGACVAGETATAAAVHILLECILVIHGILNNILVFLI